MSYKDYCKYCLNHDFNLKDGIVCKLTSKKPTFTNVCEDFSKNKKIVKKENLNINNQKSDNYFLWDFLSNLLHKWF